MRDLGHVGFADTVGMGRLSGPSLENPLLCSGLALAGVNTWIKGDNPPPEAEDGLLTAEESIPQPVAHPAADLERASRLNIRYQKELKKWKALSWWKRLKVKKPEPPSGI